MATSQNTLIGRASGSVDGVTFLTIFRKNVMRAKMSHQTNPSSIAQRLQRSKYGQLMGLYADWISVVNIGLESQRKKMTIVNLFQSLNIKNVFTDNMDGTATLNYESLQISKGTIGKQFVTNMIISFFDNPIIQWDYTNFKPYNSSPNDEAHAVLISSQTGQYWFKRFNPIRSSNSLEFLGGTLPDIGYSYYVLLFFQNPVTKQVSDTVFFERKFE